MSRYRYLPLSLQGVFLVLVLAPAAAVCATAMSWAALSRADTLTLSVAALCYVVIPLGLATLLMRRHPAFLYLLIAECVFLLASAFLRMPTHSQIFINVHYGFVLTMVLLAVMLINRDILFPFIFTGHRGFRQAPRLAVNQMVRVHVPRIDRTFEMMIEDCSLTGVALYGTEDHLDPMLAANTRGDPLLVICTIGRLTHQVPMTYLWQAKMSSIIKIGLVARDQRAMGAMFHALGLRQPKRARFKLAEFYMTPWVRRTFSYGLAVAMLLLMIGAPIAQELRHKKREAATKVAH
jgi:hypothetical protein